MEYIFKEMKPNGRNTGRKIKLIKLKSILTSLNSMYWICSPIRQGRVCMWTSTRIYRSDIYSRYKRLNGFNVLHPMGYDAYGLRLSNMPYNRAAPCCYHRTNIRRYREQLDKIGFSYDWDREIRTSEPDYYHWTQWAFIQMFNHYYDTKQEKAVPIANLVKHLETRGTEGLQAHQSHPLDFSASEWKTKSEKEQQEILLNYRIAYLADTKVNWCPALGTVLANDEVSEGYSIRGGHPVEQSHAPVELACFCLCSKIVRRTGHHRLDGFFKRNATKLDRQKRGCRDEVFPKRQRHQL